jgi:hypothetical protein
MSKSIFRKAALERLSSPEQLDQTIPITNPRGWLVLGAMAALLIAAVFWGAFGSITSEVNSRAILINSGGIKNVVATYPGQIINLSPSVAGDLSRSSSMIEAGDVVATIVEPGSSETYEIVSPYSGRILEVKAGEGDLVEKGDQILSLEFVGDDVKLESLLYLPASQASAVQPGMEVRFSPDGTPADASGFILGRVTSVGEFPSSRESMLRTLGSDELIQAISTSQAPIEIRIELLPDPENPDALLWSSGVGAPTEFRSGSLGTAVIIIDEGPPVSYLFGRS